MVVAADQPAAARCRLRRRLLRLGQLRARAQPDPRSHARRRAVRRRLRRQRRHPRAHLPVAGLQRQQHRLVRLEGQRLLRDRQPQHEVRLSGHVDGGQAELDDQHDRARLPRQQRRAQSAHADAHALPERRLRGMARRVLAGAVHARPPDAPGRGALRPSPAAGFRSRRSVRRSTSQPDRVPGDQGRGQLQGRHAADGRRLRSVRQRQDRAQGQRSANYLEGVGVSTNYANANPTLRIPTTLGPVRRSGRHADVDRRQHRLPAGLRSQQPAGTGSAGRRRRLLRHRVEHALGAERAHQQLRPGPAERLGRASVGLELLGGDPAADPPPPLGGGLRINRRSFRGFTVQDNTLAAVGDYTPYSIAAPPDPRLPGGGGYTVHGLFDVVAEPRRPDSQHRHRLVELRRHVAGLQRRGRHGERATGRPHVPGRHQHRPDDVRFL